MNNMSYKLEYVSVNDFGEIITGKTPQECIEKLLLEPFEDKEKIPILAGSDNCALHLEKNANISLHLLRDNL